MGEKQGGSLKKNNKLIVEQCKLYPKVQLATHTVQPVLSFCSQQTALPWLAAQHGPSAAPRTQSCCHCHGGMSFCISSFLTLTGPVNSQHFLPLVSASCSWGYIHTADYFSLSTAPQLQRLWKDLSSVHTRGNCLYYNQFQHEKWHFWRLPLSHHLLLCFLTLKQGK